MQFVEDFITISTISVLQNPRDEPFQARAMDLNLVGHHPIHPTGGYASVRA
jgi:hypothetical protein